MKPLRALKPSTPCGGDHTKTRKGPHVQLPTCGSGEYKPFAEELSSQAKAKEAVAEVIMVVLSTGLKVTT